MDRQRLGWECYVEDAYAQYCRRLDAGPAARRQQWKDYAGKPVS